MSKARLQKHCGNPTPKAPDKSHPGQRMAAERKLERQAREREAGMGGGA